MGGELNQPITARKMAKQPPERRIRQLMAYFPYRGDKLPYTTLRNITAGEAAEMMAYCQSNTGYYLTWVVWWDIDDKLLKIAGSFGAEAYANGGRTMYNSADREDMAHHYGVDSWVEIPIEDRNELTRAFFEGVEAERKTGRL